MAITTAAIARQLEPGLNAMFGMSYKRRPTQYTELFETFTSDRNFEEDLKRNSFGLGVVKPEGQSVSFDEAGEAYISRYEHVTIAKGTVITEEALEDNQYEKGAMQYARALGTSLAQTKEVRGANILNNAFDSDFLGGDGVSLCNASHPIGALTISNTASAALSESSLEAALTAIRGWTDDRGKLIAAMPRKLVVPPALVYTAERLLKSAQRVGTGDNDINALRSMGVLPGGSVVNDHLTDTNNWFILTDIDHGLKHFKRKGLTKRMVEMEDTFSLKYIVSERYSFGWSDPLAIFGAAVA